MPKGEDDHSPEGGRNTLSLREWQKQGYDAHSRAATRDTLFVDPEHGDYHLRPNSPAIGAGEARAEVAADLEGRSREGRKGWEAGCYVAREKKGGP